jgi:hypothetical protein
LSASCFALTACVVHEQRKRDAPWRYTEKFPSGEEASGQHMVSINWLLNDAPLTPKEKLALNILDDLLVGNRSVK